MRWCDVDFLLVVSGFSGFVLCPRQVWEVKVLPCCDYDVSVDFFALLRVCDCGFFLHCCECVIVDFFACEYVIDCCEYVIVGALQPMWLWACLEVFVVSMWLWAFCNLWCDVGLFGGFGGVWVVSFFGKIFSRNSAHVDQFLATKIQFMMDNFGPQTHTHTHRRTTDTL